MRNGFLAVAAAVSLSSCAHIKDIYRDARDVMVIEDVYRTNRGNDCDALFWPGSKNCGIFCYEDQEDVSGFPINFLIEERVAASVLHEGYCTSPTHEIAALFQDNIPLDLGLERQ